MTYRQEMGRLAREVAKLLAEGGKVPGADIPAALAGHSSVVGLLRTIQADLSATEWRGVSELSIELQRQPRINDQPLTSIVMAPTKSRAGDLWTRVAKAANFAQQEWDQSTLASRPFGDAAWSEVADVAALAEAVGLLDEDIANSLTTAGRWREAADFRTSQAGLIGVAQEVRRLAGTGPLPTAQDLRPVTPETVIPVPTPELLPKALEHLTALVNSANNLPPAQVELISRVVAETAISAANGLQQAGDPAPSALRAHAERLSAVTGYSKRIAPLRMGSGKAIAQAQQIHQVLRNLQLRGGTLSPRVARAAARAVPPITKGLLDAAERQVKRGLWLMCREGNGPLRWTPSLGSVDEPRILNKLREANKHGGTVTQFVGRAPTGGKIRNQPSPIPRRILAGPLADRGSPVPIVRRPAEMRRRR